MRVTLQKTDHIMLRLVAVTFISLLLLTAIGCQWGYRGDFSSYAKHLFHKGFNAKMEPRVRIGSYASSTIGTNFLGLDLGSHGYGFSASEKNGVVYTCKGGFIDIAHLRKAADWTAYFAAKTFKHLMNDETEFSFKMKEPSLHFVHIEYPAYWQDFPRREKKQIASDISISLGQYLAFTAATWHEILTWFGYKCTGIYSEFPSAFSWEDTFSNLLGTHLAVIALNDSNHTYNDAMTLAIELELKKLGIQSGETAKQTAEKLKGIWFSGDLPLFVMIKKRNFDIGLDDGFITPWIVPGNCKGTHARSYPVPTLQMLDEYGFSVKYEIEPREWEKSKILRVVYPNKEKRKKRLEPATHFGQIMAYIKKKAIKQYGHDVNSPL